VIKKISKDQLAEVHAGGGGHCGCACTCYCGCNEDTMYSTDLNNLSSSTWSVLSNVKGGMNNPVD